MSTTTTTKNGNLVRIPGRPGDIKIHDFFTSSDHSNGHRDLYLEVGNVSASSYVKNAAKTRLFVANEKEKDKNGKYLNTYNIWGLGFESYGGSSPNCKKIFRYIAERLNANKNIEISRAINQVRASVLAVLMQHNARMILSSFI